jgi:tetratricopeptide (TPR) repeat protein
VNAGEEDPETLGIFARTWADRYKASGSELHLRKSRDCYGHAFENAPKDYYTGINTASKSVLLGEADEAEKYATRVEEIVGTDKRPGDYWMTATVAEVQLIRQNYDRAAKLYSEAVAMTPEEIGSHKSTWNQAQLLMEKLETSGEKKAQAAKAFAHLQS